MLVIYVCTRILTNFLTDISDNGSLDYEEFEKFVVEKDILNKRPDDLCLEMMEAFNTFDKNGDGFIVFEELKVVLTQIGELMKTRLATLFSLSIWCTVRVKSLVPV